jgi:iron complex outermembrane receptor protein
VSFNRIASWTQFYDVYDESFGYLESVSQTHADVAPLLTPPLLISQRVELQPTPEMRVALGARIVASSYLDNTGSAAFETPAFFDLGLSASYQPARLAKLGKPRLAVQVNNLLNNRREFAGGYSYQYFVRGLQGGDSLAGTSYYYPLATRSVFLTLRFEL